MGRQIVVRVIRGAVVVLARGIRWVDVDGGAGQVPKVVQQFVLDVDRDVVALGD
jgi:hypothetical protein